MSGFSYHHDHSPEAPSLYDYSFVQVPSSLERDDTNIECFQGLPFHFVSKEVNATSSIDATEVPSSGVVCGLNKSNDDDLNADTGVTTRMPKRRKKNNFKVASSKNDEKKMTASINKMEKERQSPGTPEKGYVHVRARRGQATDSHSLAERVRREKIGEKMKLLQSLVPGCDKIAGKAQVLDEIINYVQSLQTQVQNLVGKLSIMSPYESGYEANLGGNAPPATATDSVCSSLEASLSCTMEYSCNLLYFADDSRHNSLVSASSSDSLGDHTYFIPQGTEIPLWETDVQGHISAMDQYWLDHYLAQLE